MVENQEIQNIPLIPNINNYKIPIIKKIISTDIIKPLNNYQIKVEISKPNLILDHLYQGSWSCSHSLELLQDLNIKNILCVGVSLETKFPDNFNYKHIKIEDEESQSLIQYFPEAYEFIESSITNNENILIHCYAGISRSSCFVLCYLIKKLKINYENAIKFLKEKRPQVNPNLNFVKELNKWSEFVNK